MINITVYQNGDITGDKGKIIGYEGQSYSETINIVHPIFIGTESGGVEYFVDYKYNQTIYRDKLDANNNIKLKLEKAGYLKCQLVAVDIVTSQIVFKSKTWNFLVQHEMQPEPSHYPCINKIYTGDICNHSNYPNMHTSCNCNHDTGYEAYYKLLQELRNEEDIRYNELQEVRNDILDIKNTIGMMNDITISNDANLLITSGTYYLSSNESQNTPQVDSNITFKVLVNTHANLIIQEAYEMNGNRIWYRVGNKVENDTTWTTWTQMNTNVI